jgi:hypothetical protein
LNCATTPRVGDRCGESAQTFCGRPEMDHNNLLRTEVT